ncbi:MAG: hypothetical protein KIT81_00615 [Alphaproteobacteria bacterium]|nr:hypothetical protein [Alphaproteobacteria bacterium]
MADWLRKCGVCCLGLAMFLGLSFGGSTNATAGALLFTQNSWVEAPDSPSLNYPGSFTMEAWINFTSYGTCCWNAVIAKQFSHPRHHHGACEAGRGGDGGGLRRAPPTTAADVASVSFQG